MPLQAVHNFFKQYGPLPKMGTTTVTSSGVSDYGGKPMSVIKVTYEGRGQKRKRDDSGGKRGDRAAGRGGVGQQNGVGNGADAGGQWGKEWPGGTKKYCRFALGKTNMDTQVGVQACCQGSKSLHKPINHNHKTSSGNSSNSSSNSGDSLEVASIPDQGLQVRADALVPTQKLQLLSTVQTTNCVSRRKVDHRAHLNKNLHVLVCCACSNALGSWHH